MEKVNVFLIWFLAVWICCAFGTAPLRMLSKAYSPSLVQGILQIHYNGSWGTICDDNWDMTDTRIACKQLGYKNASTFKHLGQGPDPIWLDDVDCNGGESSLDQCTHIGWGVHNCGHHEDVGIVCNTGKAQPLRLASKEYSSLSVKGILQIYHNGQWGTICDDYWDMTDTNIACKQLGYTSASTYKHLGQGTDPIWLDDVDCNGGESSLDQCTHIGWGVHNCGHSEDVGIECTGAAPLRLLSKTTSSSSVQGILQIFYNGQWGTICDDHWDMTDTNIACKQLGYDSALSFTHLGQGTGPIWLDDVVCNGGESTLDQCTHGGWAVHNCGHGEDVGIVCNSGKELRLLGKTFTRTTVQGILQIFHNNKWGTICDDGWDMTDTNIACKQLGYERAVTFKHVGQGTNTIWLDEVDCNGVESTVDQCHHRGWGKHDCDHSEDVGIVCNSGTAPLMLLGKTYSPSFVQGIVQIYYNGQWGTICDNNWYMTNTNIACKQLGYESGVTYKHLGQGPDPIWLDNVECTGGEYNLNQCHHRGWGVGNCDHSKDVGIVCYTGTAPLMLLGKTYSPSFVQGILQIYYNGQWGTICDNNWYMTNTNIACKQLGYESGVTYKHLGQGPDPIWLDNVECTGGEYNLNQCHHRGWGVGNCDHSKDVGIVCYTGPPVNVRLIGDVPNAGRVQLFYKGVWKNVCGSIWNNASTYNVICRMAGYPDGYAVYFNTYKGSGDVWISSSSCSRYEHVGLRHSNFVSFRCAKDDGYMCIPQTL